MKRYDSDYKNWKPGDKVVWDDDLEGEVLTIDHFNRQYYWVYFVEGQMTRETNLLRVREIATVLDD
jgi:hypothetical protein